jgi:hypothetical protein
MKRSLLAAALAATAAACAQPSGPESAVSEQTLRLSAIVQTVDMDTRQVLLVGESGRPEVFVAGPEVRNLAQLEPGDRVVIDYFEQVAARMAAPGDLEEPIAVAAMGRAAEGERPGGFVASSEEMIVEFVSYDPATEIVTIIPPSGEPLSLPLRNPDMRAFAETRSPGDRVHVTITESVAVRIEEV